MTSHDNKVESQRELLRRAVAVLEKEPEILLLTLEGSLSRGDNDAWSDVDLELFCQASCLESAWNYRATIFHQIGEVLCIADISDMVPWACIAFYGHSRLHLTYRTPEEHKSTGKILFDRKTSSEPTHYATLTIPTSDALSSPRFAFWLNRAFVGAYRADKMQMAESRLRLLEIWLSMVARSRLLPFYGLRKASAYLTLDEMQWCDNYLANLHSLDLIQLLPELVQEDLKTLRDPVIANIDISGVRFIEMMLAEIC